MEPESNPILLSQNIKKPPSNPEPVIKEEKKVPTVKKDEEPDMLTRFRMLKKLKNDLEEVKKKESNGMEIDDGDDGSPPLKSKPVNKKKEIISAKLIDSKRKKMLIQQKYEMMNGKKTEIIKEYNESEEESISKSNNETPNRLASSNEDNQVYSGLEKVKEFDISNENENNIENNETEKDQSNEDNEEKREDKNKHNEDNEISKEETNQKEPIQEEVSRKEISPEEVKNDSVEKDKEKEEEYPETFKETEERLLIKQRLKLLALEKKKLEQKMEENKNIPFIQRKSSYSKKDEENEKEKEVSEKPKEEVKEDPKESILTPENGNNNLNKNEGEESAQTEKKAKSSKSELKNIIEILKAKNKAKEKEDKVDKDQGDNEGKEEGKEESEEEEKERKRRKEKQRLEKLKREEEELKQQRLRELEEQKAREAKRLEEEEERRREEEKRKKEEERRREEERIAEEKRKEEERIAEEKRQEELKRLEQERLIEMKRQEEIRKKEEAALAEKLKKEELRKKKEERKKREAKRKEEERKIQEELKRIEEVKKLELQLLEEKLNYQKTHPKNENSTTSTIYKSKKSDSLLSPSHQPYQKTSLQLPDQNEYLDYPKKQKKYSQSEVSGNFYQKKYYTDNSNDQPNQINRVGTYQKPVKVLGNIDYSSSTAQSPQTVIYNPKKPGIRGRSNERIPQPNLNISDLNDINNISQYSQNNPNNISTISKSKTQQYRHSNSDDIPYRSESYNTQQNFFQINLEDLMILEEKLTEAMTALEAKKFIQNECFEWWNYYFNCSLYNRIELMFKDARARHVVQMSIKFELLSLLISYDVSSDNILLTQILVMIQAILNLNHCNLIVICEYVLSRISEDNLDNIWVFKLRNLVNSHESDLNYMNSNYSYIEKIKLNTNSVSNYIKIILKNYPNNPKKDDLSSLYKNLATVTYQDINDLFQEKFMMVENPNASVLASVVLRQNGQFNSIEPPYLTTKNLKPYTLVLDLDETIIHFRVNPNNELEGVMKVRPGIYDFLETLGKYYEMIVFTTATSEYADILLDSIEENKIYFDYRFYREHSIIVDNDFVKDLTRIGRPLDKTIIVDNMPQNFRLQKENGIIIKGFFGDDPYDTALIELTPILLSIAKEGGDVRKSLAKYRDDIVKKVTSNISRQIH